MRAHIRIGNQKFNEKTEIKVLLGNGNKCRLSDCETSSQSKNHSYFFTKESRNRGNKWLLVNPKGRPQDQYCYIFTYFGCIIHMTLWLLYNVHNDKSIDCRAIIVSLNPKPICGKTNHTILGPTFLWSCILYESKTDVEGRIKLPN